LTGALTPTVTKLQVLCIVSFRPCHNYVGYQDKKTVSTTENIL